MPPYYIFKRNGKKMIYIRTDLKEIESKIEFLKENRVGAEITLYDTSFLLKTPKEIISEKIKIIKENNIETTVHLPMYGNDYGTKDVFIREYSVDICKKALDIAEEIGAKKAVFHSGFNPLNPPSVRKHWFNIFAVEFRKILDYAKDREIIIASENVWDIESEYFDFVASNFRDDNSKFCFDIGHSQIYLTKVNHAEFFKKYRKLITHIHVHDNNITAEDEHLHIGEGIIDFEKYITLIKDNGINPTYTLEVKFDDKVINDINFLRKRI